MEFWVDLSFDFFGYIKCKKFATFTFMNGNKVISPFNDQYKKIF